MLNFFDSSAVSMNLSEISIYSPGAALSVSCSWIGTVTFPPGTLSMYWLFASSPESSPRVDETRLPSSLWKLLSFTRSEQSPPNSSSSM